MSADFIFVWSIARLLLGGVCAVVGKVYDGDVTDFIGVFQRSCGNAAVIGDVAYKVVGIIHHVLIDLGGEIARWHTSGKVERM